MTTNFNIFGNIGDLDNLLTNQVLGDDASIYAGEILGSDSEGREQVYAVVPSFESIENNQSSTDDSDVGSNGFKSSSILNNQFGWLGDIETQSFLPNPKFTQDEPSQVYRCNCSLCQSLTTSNSGSSSDSVLLPQSGITVASGDNRIDSLRSGYRIGSSGSANVTFSFVNSVTAPSYSGEVVSEVSDAIKNNVRTILTTIYAPILGLNFTEVTESAGTFGQIRYMFSNMNNTGGYAYAYYPTSDSTASKASDVHLSNAYITPSSNTNNFANAPGSHGFATLIHETGHALGLKHPGNYNAGGGGTDGPYLPYDQDNFTNTVMTYNFTSGEPSTLMSYDILALRYTYGAKNFNVANTTYNFSSTTAYITNGSSPTSSGSSRAQLLTLVDDGGIDTLNFSALPSNGGGYRFDLRSGGFITTQSAYNASSYLAYNDTSGTRYSVSSAGTRIYVDTTIENLVNSSSNDYIIASSASNIFSGYSAGSSTGNDTIEGADNLDSLDLSTFTSSSVSQTQSGNNLVLGLGTGKSVTIKDYYLAQAANRINIQFAAATTLAIAATDASKNEGNSGTTPFIFTVTRSGDISSATTVNYAVTGSGANLANAADFGGTLPSGTVSFAANDTTKVITVNVSGDTVVESDEGFTVTLSNPSSPATITTATATGSIVNDDTALAIAATDASKNEGNSGTTPFTFTVTRNGNLSSATTVNYAVTGSGANLANAADFGGTLPSGTVSFAATETSKVITVNISGDTVVESDEGFTVTLSSPSSPATITTATATGSILNDDSSWIVGGVGDFGGDSKADILWINSNAGLNALWEMNGANIINPNYISNPALSAAWAVGGVGDFSGDAKADILWRNSSTGQNLVWGMNGNNVNFSNSINTLPFNWIVGGVGDFGGDGIADILWRDTTTGASAIWQMNGGYIASGNYIPVNSLSSSWAVGGVGDFSGDGKADILWRNSSTGENLIWQMDGYNVIATTSINNLASNWIVGGVGDFGGDGIADILWRDTTTGNNAIWQMSSGYVASGNFISMPALTSDWTVGGVSDFGGDGKADILWRNSAGQNLIWQMNGFNAIASNFTTPLV